MECPIVFRAGGNDNVSMTVDRDCIEMNPTAIGRKIIITKITPMSGNSDEIMNAYRYLLEWIAVVRYHIIH